MSSLLAFIGAVLMIGGLQAQSSDRTAVASAAKKFLPGVTWQAQSVIAADFTCDGRVDQAILGLDPKDIVIAIFIQGLGTAPEVSRSGERRRELVKIRVESLDYDPKEVVEDDLPGFRRSKSCKGINLYDDLVDSLHLYWNHTAKRFDGWSL